MIYLKAISKELEPYYATSGAAAADVIAAEDVIVTPGEIVKIPTGLFIHHVVDAHRDYIPHLKLALRSGFSSKTGLTIPNGYGIIDHDYRGEIKVIVTTTLGTVRVKKGDRIAQVSEERSYRLPGVVIVDKVREGGFGSTGGR